MEILQSHITIGKYTFDFVTEIQVETSWMEQTSKGSITLPANLLLDSSKLKTEIKRGDAVEIFIGYGDAMYNVFNGYVARLKPTVPVVIEIEDEMWKLKQHVITDTCKNESLKSFLSRNIPNIHIDCFDITVPRFIANKITAAKLLDEIKSNYGLYSFFRRKSLVIGKQYEASDYNVQQAKFNYNIVSDNLEYRVKEDVNLKITAISNMPNGDKLEVQLGSKDGEERTLNFYNLPKSELRKVAQKEMDRLIYDGYRGDLTLFLEPFVRIGDVLELKKDDESDKTGRYWVDAVVYTFGINGARQKVTLGART